MELVEPARERVEPEEVLRRLVGVEHRRAGDPREQRGARRHARGSDEREHAESEDAVSLGYRVEAVTPDRRVAPVRGHVHHDVRGETDGEGKDGTAPQRTAGERSREHVVRDEHPTSSVPHHKARAAKREMHGQVPRRSAAPSAGRNDRGAARRVAGRGRARGRQHLGVGPLLPALRQPGRQPLRGVHACSPRWPPTPTTLGSARSSPATRTATRSCSRTWPARST